jgi:integrase
MDDETRRVRAAVQALRAASMAKVAAKPSTPPPLPVPEPEKTPVFDAIGRNKDDSKLSSEPKSAKKLSKKLDLAKLPKNWRNQIFSACKPEKPSRLTSAVAMLWATGCRPVEIEKGVQVQMVDGQLVIEIRGAKVGQITNSEGTFERGLEWRKLTLNPKLNAATEYLAALCADGQLHQVDYNKNSLRTRLNEIGRLALKKLKHTPLVSPYTFRHAMGSDVKSCDDLTDEERSQIMGHLSCDSLSVYGRRRHRGGVSPVASVAASAVPHGDYTDAPKKPKTGAKPK